MTVPFLGQVQEGSLAQISLAVCLVDLSLGSEHCLHYLLCYFAIPFFLQVICRIKDAVTIRGLLSCISPSACLMPFLSQRHTQVSLACSYGTVEMFCDLNSQPKASLAMVMDQGLLEQGNADTMNVHGISPLPQTSVF